MAFDPERADGAWLLAWLTGRSLARGLPLPVADRGGWRAEIGSEGEARRWVYPSLCPELRAVAGEIAEPGLNLRALATPAAMQAFLPPGWLVEPSSYTMTGPRPTPAATLPAGYRLETHGRGGAWHAFILSRDGQLAASGHLGVGEQAAVYDRIVSHPGHRRQGLGRAIMGALAAAEFDQSLPQLLVATQAGRRLYAQLGWREIAPYASARWIGDSPVQN